MRGVFYSPFVKPRSDVASGAARMADLFCKGLRGCGVQLDVPDLPRTFDGEGNETAQVDAARASHEAADQFLRDVKSGCTATPDFWFSYHVYYKSPDWIGPTVAGALKIPYLIAEGSYAPKRQSGPWKIGHEASTVALRRANMLLAMTEFDRFCLSQLCPGKVRDLKPFIDTQPFEGLGRAKVNASRIVSMGMMRNERKLESYRLIARVLEKIDDRLLSLQIAGDGPLRPRIEDLFAGTRKRHAVSFLGAVPADKVPRLLFGSGIFFWPGVGEAYGLSFLEAQACGLPVIACRNRGVVDVTLDGSTAVLCALNDVEALCKAVRTLSSDDRLREKMSKAAREFVTQERSLSQASRKIGTYLREAGS